MSRLRGPSGFLQPAGAGRDLAALVTGTVRARRSRPLPPGCPAVQASFAPCNPQKPLLRGARFGFVMPGRITVMAGRPILAKAKLVFRPSISPAKQARKSAPALSRAAQRRSISAASSAAAALPRAS